MWSEKLVYTRDQSNCTIVLATRGFGADIVKYNNVQIDSQTFQTIIDRINEWPVFLCLPVARDM